MKRRDFAKKTDPEIRTSADKDRFYKAKNRAGEFTKQKGPKITTPPEKKKVVTKPSLQARGGVSA